MCLFFSDFFKSESGLLHALMRVATLLLFLFFFSSFSSFSSFFLCFFQVFIRRCVFLLCYQYYVFIRNCSFLLSSKEVQIEYYTKRIYSFLQLRCSLLYLKETDQRKEPPSRVPHMGDTNHSPSLVHSLRQFGHSQVRLSVLRALMRYANMFWGAFRGLVIDMIV